MDVAFENMIDLLAKLGLVSPNGEVIRMEIFFRKIASNYGVPDQMLINPDSLREFASLAENPVLKKSRKKKTSKKGRKKR